MRASDHDKTKPWAPEPCSPKIFRVGLKGSCLGVIWSDLVGVKWSSQWWIDHKGQIDKVIRRHHCHHLHNLCPLHEHQLLHWHPQLQLPTSHCQHPIQVCRSRPQHGTTATTEQTYLQEVEWERLSLDDCLHILYDLNGMLGTWLTVFSYVTHHSVKLPSFKYFQDLFLTCKRNNRQQKKSPVFTRLVFSSLMFHRLLASHDSKSVSAAQLNCPIQCH